MKAEVFTGAWINWADGRIVGATLTISSQHAAFLIAFLALFVRFAGSHLWDILRYITFQHRSSPGNKDVFHQQQQVVLRNAVTDTGALWDLSQIMWAWRSKARRPFQRSIFLLVWAVLHLSAFTAAGIFSSKVTNSRSDVLLKSSHCGTFSSRLEYLTPGFNPVSNPAAVQEYISNLADAHESFIAGSNFAVSCYGNSSISSTGCLPFGRRKPTWTTTTAGTKCPFDKSMCINDQVVELDTAYLDSQLDFGINTPREDRVQFRATHTCAPITIAGFSSKWINSSGTELPVDSSLFPVAGNQLFKQYYYGPTPAYNMNSTFTWSNYSFTNIANSYIPLAYLLGAKKALNPISPAADGFGDFIAIPQIERTDAVVVLLFLATNSFYLTPVEDPWFNATDRISTVNGTFYLDLEESIRVLGCASSFHFCNNVGGMKKCVNLADFRFDYKQQVQQLNYNQKQSSVAARIWTALSISSIYSVVSALGASDLLANRRVIGAASMGLPPNQWIQELDHLFGTMLNSAQLQSAQYVLGPNSPKNDIYMTDLPAEDQWMCNSQIANRNDYVSFNILGLVIILVLGGAFIICNLALPSIVSSLQKSSSSDQKTNDNWQMYNMLQLHRLAIDGQGMGRWSGKNKAVPVAAAVQQEMTLPRSGSDSAIMRLSTVEEPESIVSDTYTSPQLSQQQVWLNPTRTRPSDRLESRSLSGTENISLMSRSESGRWVTGRFN